jgi:hypothetical protein
LAEAKECWTVGGGCMEREEREEIEESEETLTGFFSFAR